MATELTVVRARRVINKATSKRPMAAAIAVAMVVLAPLLRQTTFKITQTQTRVIIIILINSLSGKTIVHFQQTVLIATQVLMEAVKA